MKADLSDKQREFQAAKTDRTSCEQQVWETDDKLKQARTDILKSEQYLNEKQREYEKFVEELHYNDSEITKHEKRLDKVNLAIEILQRDES